MKQLTQNLRTGKTALQEVPAPLVRKGCVLIRTHKSLISSGTEKMLVKFSNANLFEKARQHPEKVKRAVSKIKSDGLVPAVRTIYNKLDQLIPLGYSNVGTVIAVGEEIRDLKIGDRVISNGPHAEIVCVPRNLVAKVPDHVPDEEAVFTVIASVALQGIRLLSPAIGETVVVTGLGLTGLLAAEILRLNGCRVIGIDPDEQKRAIASKNITTLNPDMTDAEKVVAELTNGMGADGVIITASSGSDKIISQAAHILRKRGKIVLIGVTGLHLNRADFYEKELTFQVSCSYGPGRYDHDYEQKGIDYPLPFARWTENRNFQAVLELLSSGSLNVRPLISEVIPLADFKSVYENITFSKSVAIILDYPKVVSNHSVTRFSDETFAGRKGVAGIIGAGNFTRTTMLPLLKNADLKYIASADGFSAAELARKYGIPFATCDFQEILNDKEIDLVLITTQHQQHAAMVLKALLAGKHVFVEKPLAIFQAELDEIINVWQKPEPGPVSLTVGYNRRFSLHVRKMKLLLKDSLVNVIITVNAGFVPAESWIHDRARGGGRIIGEACHFVDLFIFITGSRIEAVCMNAAGNACETSDNASMLLKCKNGSTGVINYFSNGNNAYAKERIEVYSLGRTLILDNFRTLTGYGFSTFTKLKTQQDKGHKQQFGQLLEMVRNGGAPLIPFEEIVHTSQVTFAALESLKTFSWVKI
ncbi:bi-domain-containing oxidoreductase [Dyadobacter sediminis]|uniref:Zinc-binding dehydrogenase n=1 Tax=Dyadobacter sediminis TaxID=1493691 RepID=A0A5R9K752_9BACT|nr:bi-domain-containing oxidoreductase [Dyadobacter sediminis]TLU89604.1 zinc-binding dehydrogenase [Dyadobacter sediminis]GGC03919.1 oxidoreductase [Dyadobacter sediminis]